MILQSKRQFEHSGMLVEERIYTTTSGFLLCWSKVPFDRTILQDGSLNPVSHIKYDLAQQETDSRNLVQKEFDDYWHLS